VTAGTGVASIVSHPAVLFGLEPLFGPPALSRRVLMVGALCTVVPDIDVIGYRLGIPYGSLLGHRGLTHSLLFAAVLALILAFVIVGRKASQDSWGRCAAFLFLCAASHGILDAMTDGGRGVAFFAPFDARRFFLPWRPIPVSPIGTRGFFGARGVRILAAEALWIWAPALVVGGVALGVRRLRARGRPEPHGEGER
jgi:inner membrane protein